MHLADFVIWCPVNSALIDNICKRMEGGFKRMLIDLVESDLLIPFRVITLTYFEDLVIMSLQSNRTISHFFSEMKQRTITV